MANELSTRLTNDASQFNQSMEQATEKVEQFQGATEGAQKSINDLGKKGAMSTKELLKEIGKLSGSEKNFSNYRRQLAQMTRDIQDLTVNYSNMTKEMQNSDIGKATLQRIHDLTTEAGKYKDAIMDAQQSIKNMASDTQWVDAFRESVNLASGVLQSFAAAGVLSAKSQEDLVKVIAKVKAIETSANGVMKIANALNKNSALLDAVRTIQKKALTKATQLETAATVKATIAQKAFNVVAKANPYVLIATAAIAAGTAIYAFVKHSKKAEQAQKEQEKAAKKAEEAVEREAKAFDNLKSSVGKAVGDVVSKFKALQREMKNITSQKELEQWVKNNQSAFNELGLKVDNTNDAYAVFVSKAPEVIAALKAIARAEGLQEVYKSLWAELGQQEVDAAYNAQKAWDDAYKAKERYGTATGKFPDELKQAGLSSKDVKFEWSGGQSGGGTWVLSPQQQKQVNDYWANAGKSAAEAMGDELMSETEKRIAIVEKLMEDGAQDVIDATALVSEYLKPKEPKGGNNSGGGGKKKEEEYKSQIKLLEEAIKKQQDLLPYVEDQSEEEAKILNTIVELNKQLDIAKKKHEEFLVSLRKQRTGQIEPLTVPVNPDFSAALKTANKITMPDQKLEVPVTPKLEPLYLDEWLDGLVDQIDGFAGLADGIVGSFEGVYNSVKRLGDAIDDAEGPLEKFFALWDTGMQIVNMAATVIDAVSTITTLLNGKMGIQIGLKKSDTETTKENTRAKLKNAGADAAAAIAGGAKSVADIPVVGWILAGVAAVTLLATLISAMSSAKGFATGGIVGGNSYYGDKILARLNSGELVLNRDQQVKAWDEMNQPQQPTYSNQGGKVEFVIHGTELKGVLRNIDKKNGMI